MPETKTAGRRTLEKLIGKSVVEVSYTDRAEVDAGAEPRMYLLFADGTVFDCGPSGFEVFAPGKYRGA